MIKQPPVDVMHSLSRLGADADFQRVLAWLDSEYAAKVSDMLIQSKEILVFQSQGYALCLEDLTQTARSVRTVLERHSRAEP